jgi:hypothetical protein
MLLICILLHDSKTLFSLSHAADASVSGGGGGRQVVDFDNDRNKFHI